MSEKVSAGVDLDEQDPRKHGRGTIVGNPYTVTDDWLCAALDELRAARAVVEAAEEFDRHWGSRTVERRLNPAYGHVRAAIAAYHDRLTGERQ